MRMLASFNLGGRTMMAVTVHTSADLFWLNTWKPRLSARLQNRDRLFFDFSLMPLVALSLQKNPASTPASYPTVPSPILDRPELFERFETDVLFFSFYYQQVRPSGAKRMSRGLVFPACCR